MGSQTQESAPVQAPAAQGATTEAGRSGDARQNRLGNAEVQARIPSGAGGGGGTDVGQSGAEGGSSHTGWRPVIQEKVNKLAPEAAEELERAWDAYVAHVKSNVAAGWKQGWMGDLSLIATKRTEVKMDWQELGPIKYPYPQVHTRDPEEGDPMGICWDWSKDVCKFLTGLGLKHWGVFPVNRETPEHHAASLMSADSSVSIVFDGWANWTDRMQAQLESEWM